MTTLIGFCLVALCAVPIAVIGWIILKLKSGKEPEYQTEHEFDAAEFWERK